MHDLQTNAEPLPPFVSQLLADRAKIIRLFPIRRQMDWRHSQLRPPLLQRVLSFGTSSSSSSGSAGSSNSSSYLPDNPAASFYRLYQFLVIDWTIQFRNELEYFWGQASWALATLPDPLGDSKDSNSGSSEARIRKAVMAGLTRIMKKAYNRLISEGLSRDAPPMVDDWEELRARPRVLEEIPKWAEEMGRIEPGVDIPNVEGKVVGEGEEASEDFARYGIRIAEPLWVFV
ncbi:hypothetical protein M413DRAFT_440502 [Hebeloma cylindrosporum]|uniref:Uncharacterized protein n=1 Tax=Hebeloma cylindrosporum TaxID=76867 RepID=A0A0C3CS86_HEBCY|nr:hypothetical protein M413DRAFT_440502 [Hebeloma cylindrosporum h7]